MDGIARIYRTWMVPIRVFTRAVEFPRCEGTLPIFSRRPSFGEKDPASAHPLHQRPADRPDRGRIYRVQFSTLAIRPSLCPCTWVRETRTRTFARYYGCVRAAWVISHAPGQLLRLNIYPPSRADHRRRISGLRKKKEALIRASKTGRVSSYAAR